MTPCRRTSWAWVLAGMVAVGTPASGQQALAVPAPAAPADRTSVEREYVQGLRERGYFDLASEYLQRLRKAPEIPAELKPVLDYEEARGLLDEATGMADLDRRRALLDQARATLDGFAKANPEHDLAPEALVQMGRLLLERGRTAALQAAEAPDDTQKQARLTEARASFGDARTAYDRAIRRLQAAYDASPKPIEGDPTSCDRCDRVYVALKDARLQRAMVDYEDAQSYPPGAGERNQRLDTARGELQNIVHDDRARIAGFCARMWEGKCYEEKGELGPAAGVYKELMENTAPELAPLRRKVGYFQIIVDGKRGNHALVQERASAWLQAYPNALRTEEGIGVRFELAKALLARVPKLADAEKQAATRRAMDLLAEVVRYYSPFKPEAIELLKKYKPAAASHAGAIANLGADDAYTQAEAAVSTHEWDRAVALLRQAVRRADLARDADKANRARYLMAFADYQAGKYYESAVLAEHLARRYPKSSLAPRAAEIALAALAMAYNTFNQVDRASDLDHLVGVAQYTAATWPDSNQADSARLTLGDVELGRGRYAAAAAAYEAVREQSPRRPDALVKAGDAHWRLGQSLRFDGRPAEADTEVQAAQDRLEKALAGRRAAQAAATDPGLLGNVSALAEVYRASGRPQKALALLEPATAALGDKPLSEELTRLRTGLLTIQLRAHIAVGQPDPVIADMRALDKLGGSGADLTRLYLELGRSLKREMDTLSQGADAAARDRLEKTRRAYGQFLRALTESQAGQSFDALLFAGESLLALATGDSEESRQQAGAAADVFAKIVKAYGGDAQFQKLDDAATRLLRVRLRRAEAMRREKQFPDAQAQLDEIKALSPRPLLDQMLEQGLLYEDWAREERAPARWQTSFAYWEKLSGQLQRIPARKLEYYESLYHVALALQGMDQRALAAQTLRSVLALTPSSVGSPEMKAKYENLLGRLTR